MCTVSTYRFRKVRIIMVSSCVIEEIHSLSSNSEVVAIQVTDKFDSEESTAKPSGHVTT